MRIMLSERLNPIKYPTKLEYRKTNQTFMNQSIRIVSDLLLDTHMQERDMYPKPNISIPNEVCKEFYLQVGEIPDELGKEYTGEDLIDLLYSAKDEAFLDILDLIYQIHFDHLLAPEYDLVYKEYVEKQNEIFKRNGLGYTLINGHFVQIGEEHILNNITKPCFKILHEFGYYDSSEYLINAYSRFKDGDTDGAILEAHKALESILNGIIQQFNIVVKGSKISNKIEALIEKGIIPTYEQSSMNALVQLINSSGVVRNNTVAHAQNQNNATDDLFEYVVNSVASTIIFLVKSAHRK